MKKILEIIEKKENTRAKPMHTTWFMKVVCITLSKSKSQDYHNSEQTEKNV